MSWANWHYPRFIAHRCGGALAPENTLAGLRLAARLGLRAIEFDVMLSADGLPVVIHDETLERTTDGTGPVAALPLAALRRLDAGCRHHRSFSGERLPTLDEVLLGCRQLGLAANVEIKPATGFEHETGRAVAQGVRAFMEHPDAMSAPLPVLLSSFSEAALAAARSVAPDFARALLVETVPNDWPARMQALGCGALHCAAGSLAPEQVAGVVRSGVPLACYTVNAPDEAERLFSLGVAAVFTDRLDLFPPE